MHVKQLKGVIHIFCIVEVQVSIYEGMKVGEMSVNLFLKVNALLKMIAQLLIMESSLKLLSLVLFLPYKSFPNFVTVYGGVFRI